MSLPELHRAWVLALFVSLRVLAAEDGGVADAGAPFSSGLYASCPEAPPVMTLGESMHSDAGYDWLVMHPARASRVACLMATCEADRQAKERAAAGPPPGWWVMATSVVAGSAFGAFMLGRLTAPRQSPQPPASP